MMYTVKEMFFTIQGEGYNYGKYAVFCRFTGCNLWSGLEKDRAKAICKFCDTDFIGTNGINGKKFKNAEEITNKALSIWKVKNKPFVVLTGGEPMLQVNDKLINALHKKNFNIAIETNGTIKVPNEIDWICVSPKSETKILQNYGNELKLVYPQENISPKSFENMKFDYFYLQPKYDNNYKENVILARKFCRDNPQWKLSFQMHKFIGIP
ncbi:MAG: 7-carboxy-7-deazaguanine synthase [Pseudomonadota bacterium]|nr:7-carboxy-7-deazaguanine synthase [Pseudomonadota bacterium]MEC9414671.1 7-carboxy-7-deazaguanine synthase [Pseudomonadota bacterium]